MTRFYSGVGSRETPHDILELMTRLAQHLAELRWVLRSGHATGADQAFEAGADHRAEVYLPWPGFEANVKMKARLVMSSPSHDAIDIAAENHPTWYSLSRGAKQLHSRNVHQVLGPYLDKPSDVLFCWTPRAEGGGGTGQAIRIAQSFRVPIWDLGDPSVRARIERKLAEQGEQD